MFFKPKKIEANEVDFISDIKERYETIEQRIYHGSKKYFVDTLNCHAVAGTLEGILLWLKDFKGKVENPKLLNLGGGVGIISDIIRGMNFDVVNVDIEIKDGDEKNIQFDLNSRDDLPLDENIFDVVLCQEIIEHLENPWEFFRKAHKHLKVGGTMIVTTPNILSKKSRKIFRRTGYFHWFMPKNFTYHINPIPYWEMELIADKVGFEPLMLKGSSEYYLGEIGKDEVIKNCESLTFYFRKKG